MSSDVIPRPRNTLSAPAAGLWRAPLIGRHRELTLLVEAATRSPCVALLEGEAGIGKTRLVNELLGDPKLANRRGLVGSSHALREPFPLGPVVEALSCLAGTVHIRTRERPLLGALRPLLPELADELPPQPPPLADPNAERHRLFRALVGLLEVTGPTLLVLEDLHAGDGGTSDFLRFLVSRMPSNLSLLVTYRAEDLVEKSQLTALSGMLAPGTHRLELSLEPLDPQEVGAFAASILELDEVSEVVSDYLHEQTAGIPFAIEEVMRLLRDRGEIDQLRKPEVLHLRVPGAVGSPVLQRLERLTINALRIVRASAVVGVPAGEKVLSDVAGLPPVDGREGLCEALRASLLHEGEPGQYGFRHGLAAQAVHEAIPTPERRQLHVRAADALRRETPLPLTRLARHAKEAGQITTWRRYTERAADRAIASGDDAAACRLLLEALAAAPVGGATRVRLALKLARSSQSMVRHIEIVESLREVIDDDALSPGVRGELRLHLATLLFNQAGESALARAEMIRAADELRHRPDVAVFAMGLLAEPVLSVEGNVDEHLEWMRRAVDAAERSGRPDLRRAALMRQAWLLLQVGDPGAWSVVRDTCQEPTSREGQRQMARHYCNLAYAATCLGRYSQAQTFRHDSLRLVDRETDPFMVSALDSTGLLLDWATGNWQDLEARTDDVLARLADEVSFPELGLVKGLMLLVSGHPKRAETVLAPAYEQALRGGPIPEAATAAAALARCALASNDVERACRHALDGLHLISNKRLWVSATEVAPAAIDALIAAGRAPEAKAAMEEFEHGLRGRDAAAAQAALVHCKGRLAQAGGELEDAADLFAAAESAWGDLPRPYDAARAAEARAQCLLSASRADAPRLLLDVLERYRALGASSDAARCRDLLRLNGIPVPTHAGRRGYGRKLSPREQEVATLMAAGHSNAQIAQTLTLSSRTVEKHAARVLHKLGFSSRETFCNAAPSVEHEDAW